MLESKPGLCADYVANSTRFKSLLPVSFFRAYLSDRSRRTNRHVARKSVHCGCVIYGNRRFCASMTKALVACIAPASHTVSGLLPPRIFQRGLVSTCRLPRRYDLVLDPKCLLVEKGYLSCSILFHSIFAHLTTQRSDRITPSSRP